MPDDKSSDEFFMKIREKGKKRRKNQNVVFFAIKIAREGDCSSEGTVVIGRQTVARCSSLFSRFD